MRYDVEREKIYVRTEADGCCLYTLWIFFFFLKFEKELKTEEKKSFSLLFYEIEAATTEVEGKK